MVADEISVPHYILLYAFRYALERTTSAPNDVLKSLLQNWKYLPEGYRMQICEDIRSAKRRPQSEYWAREIAPVWQALLDYEERLNGSRNS